MASIAKKSLDIAGLFEAEILTELLLWRWDHPLKNDPEFRNNLLEDAVVALRHAVDGEKLIESVSASDMNLIAAIYYVEWNSISFFGSDPDGSRSKWLKELRRALPSCFCEQQDLPPT